MSTSNTFTVTDVRTAPKASKCAAILHDRSDIGSMSAQRDAASTHGRDTLQALLVADFEATICSRAQHMKFLAMVIGEVPNYHQRVSGAQISPNAMQVLLAHALGLMKGTPKRDRYADCLGFFSSKRMYDATFVAKANELAQYQ